MIRVFLDAAVLISATISATGASRELFSLADQGKIELITNEFAIVETERNLSKKVPHALALFQTLMEKLPITIMQNPTLEEVIEVANYTELKDAPIVAGAINANATFLATFDKKHLINPPEVSQNSGVIIATAGTVLNTIRKDLT